MRPIGPLLSGNTTPLLLLAAVLAVLSVAACGPAPSSASLAPLQSQAQTSPTKAPATSPSAISETTPSSSNAVQSPAAGPFAFSANAITSFYENASLGCNPPAPSTTAAGWFVRTCEGENAESRPVAIGVITDESGVLGAGFAAVTALPDEDLLEPTDAIDTLSGFLGAMLGEEPATELLPWLADHLGDEYAETTVGGVTVATYTESADDSTRIYLEIDGPTYLAAPPPD